VPIPTSTDDLKAASRYRQIKISVIGGDSPGRRFPFPSGSCWTGRSFIFRPCRAQRTQWYKNVLRNSQIRIDARGTEAEFGAKPVTGAKAVKSVVQKLREKYGARDLKKYYSKFDVAVRVELN